jgi:hypothetical protein
METMTGHQSEDQLVRQYRYLLRTAPLDALQSAHHEALEGLSPGVRAQVLAAIQDGLVAGQRLGADDIAAMARLVSVGERRNPRGFLDVCEPAALQALAAAVNQAEASFGLFAAYAAWDGVDPEPRDPGVDHGGDPRSRRHEDAGAEAKALAQSHAMSVQPWAGGGF